MKNWTIAFVSFVAVALLAYDAAAQPPADRERPAGAARGQGPAAAGRVPGRGPGGGQQRSLLILALDADQDGEISAAEIENAVAALKKLDLNGDGKLTIEEMRPPRPEGQGQGGQRPSGQRQGGQGQGGQGQGGQRPDGQGQGGQRPGDQGQGGQAGRGPGRMGGGDFVEFLMGRDANGDGKVTKDEMPEQMQRILERGDTNGDGAIDKEEAEAIAARFQAGGQQRAGGRPGGPGGQGGGTRPQRPE